MPTVNSVMAAIFSRMSVERCAGFLEGINGITQDGLPQEGF
jgi:hypothetical protein